MSARSEPEAWAEPGHESARTAKNGGSRILKNFSTLTVVKLASDVFTFVLFVVLSRIFGQDGIGQYSFAMAVTGFFALFADFGLYNLTIKEASREDGSLAEAFGISLILRGLYSVLGLVLLWLVAGWLPISEQGRTIVLLLGFYQFAYRLTYGMASFFVAKERMGVAAGLEFALRSVTAIAGVGIALSGGGLVLAVSVLPAVASIEVLVAFALAVRQFGAPRLRVSPAALIDTAKRALPYGLSGVLFQLQSRVDVFLIGLILTEAAVGVYTAAFRVVFLLSFLTYYAGVAIFPAASKLFADSPGRLQSLYRDASRLFVLLGVPAGAGVAVLAPRLVPLIFGSGFAETVAVLQGLALLVVVTGAKNLLSFFLMACDGQLERVKCQWIAATANVLLNLACIPLMGVMGAVVAVSLAEILLVGLLLAKLRSRIGTPEIGSRLVPAVLATACFAAPVAFMGTLPLLLIVPGAVIVYVAVLFGFRDVRRSELMYAVQWLRVRMAGNGASALPS